MQKQYQLRDKVYTIADCSESEIPSHLERVSSYWSKSIKDLSTQIPRLKQCIDEGIAVKMLDENDECQLICYLLYSPRDRVIALGQYFWVTNNRCMAMFLHWLKHDKGVAMAFFMPFNMNPVPFKKIVEEMFDDIVFEYENEQMIKNGGIVKKTTSLEILGGKENV